MAQLSASKFCRCIKKVKRTLKYRASSQRAREQIAIAICTKSMLHRRGKTLKKFTCRKKKMLETQSMKKN